MGEGSERAQCGLLGSHPTFHHFPSFPQADFALSGADPQVGGFVYILGPCGSLQWTLLWGWEFPATTTPHRFFFTAWGFESLVSPWWNPGFHSLSRSLFVPPGLSAQECGIARPPATALPCPLHPVAHLSPSYHLDECVFNSLVVGLPCKRFSHSSGCSLFLNWLLSFFWLFEEAKYFCLWLYLGRDPIFPLFTKRLLNFFNMSVSAALYYYKFLFPSSLYTAGPDCLLYFHLFSLISP